MTPDVFGSEDGNIWYTYERSYSNDDTAITPKQRIYHDDVTVASCDPFH